MSRAIGHPGLTRRVRRRHRPTRMTCVSSGTTSLAGDTRVHTPRSSASRRTIHRRNRFIRLQPLPRTGAERNSRRRGVSALFHTPHAGRAPARASKTVERGFDILRRRVVAFEEEIFDRPGAVDHLPHDPQQRDQIRSARPPMDDIGERGAVTMGIEAAHVGRRLAAHHRQHALDRLQHARDAPERQRRGAEADDLAILRRLPPADNLDRIGRRIRIVEALVQPIERRLQFAGNPSAILSAIFLQSAILQSL